MNRKSQIGLGGGCHWCTEAVFQALNGVIDVQQGYIASIGNASSFSEAIIVTYLPGIIPLKSLIEVHLHTHKCTSSHSFRKKYRSAVYFLDPEDEIISNTILEELGKDFKEEIITQVLPYKEFQASRDALQNYYLKDPDRPFCRRYINPKLETLRRKFDQDLKPGFVK